MNNTSGERGVAGFHKPVLPGKVVELLQPKAGKIIVDATLGSGGHSKLLLDAGADVIGIDWDEVAVKIASKSLSIFIESGRLRIINNNFVNLPLILNSLGVENVDGMLLDLGLSSMQIEDAPRGFSFKKDGPLDMRMSKKLKTTAKELLENLTPKELERIFREHGQEKHARKIARAIYLARERGLVPGTTLQLAGLIRKQIPPSNSLRIDPATRVFQALRITVNNELENLKKILSAFDKYLKKEGRIVVISYHSLEDKIVKNIFREKQKSREIKILTKKPLRPDKEEIKINPRSRSAKLRAAEKC
jgi:16S rRNA (cytosine1402-N4)-methyltransferase